ncbi:MAG: ABC transporter ATP-binding protein [Acidimicrobiales bacterium]
MSAFELHDLVVSYDGVEALSGIDYALAEGSWLGLIGANGAGKSTLLRALARLVAYRGTVRVGGAEVAHLSRRRLAQQVAFVPQTPELPREMRAIDYVALGRTPYLGYFAVERPADRHAGHELLARLGLAALAERPVGALSGGEVQRLVLARALAQEAPVLLLDEPTSALDLGRRVEALELVDQLRAERGLTVVAAMHDLTLAGQFATEVALLDHGRLARTGTPDAVLTDAELGRYFGASVRVLRDDDGDLVVVPRRQRGGPS